MYTRREKEINHVSAAYFTDIIIHYGFGERLRVFHAFLEKLNRGSLNIEQCCCGHLTKFPQMLKVFTLYT